MALVLCTAPMPIQSVAQVPTLDPRGIATLLLQLDHGRQIRSAETDETARQIGLLELHDQQLAALDETLQLLTGTSGFIPDLEGGGSAGPTFAAANVYSIDDDNPYIERLMGDAPVTIEMMIAETAVKFGSHPALTKAGMNAVEFRCWFQALIKQESNFSIGARSHKAAFGLTQIIPGTAQELGIYPAYYDDPRLQLDGGARYLLQQLNRFGTMPLALAAYNAGPGAVQKHGGIPPYRETQDYVVKVSANYDRYAARMNGAADMIGTLDPKDMAIAEASNVADAGMHYAAHSMNSMTAATTRLRSILVQVEHTSSVKEAMDLNTYARGEVARIANILLRLAAAQRRIEGARHTMQIQALIEDEQYLQVRLNQ